MNNTELLTKYREYNPYTEAILTGKSGVLLVIDRYGVNDYGVWWTDEEHLYDEFYGTSSRGTFEVLLENIKDDI